MRDRDIGKRITEETTMQSFLNSYPLVTGDKIELVSQGESPDFIVRIHDREVGLELTEIHADTPDKYMDEVIRLATKKEATYERLGVFARPTILLCHGSRPPLYDMRVFLGGVPSWIDMTETKFSEIWLMDLSDEYFSPQDPRKPADLYCLAPAEKRGFYEVERTRKPFG